MRVTDQVTQQITPMLTRDLLVRAAYAPPGEARALEFRALHLNLPLVGEAALRLGLGAAETRAAEHDALDGLLEAVRAFDPYGEAEFAEVAAPYVEQRLHAGRARRPRRERRAQPAPPPVPHRLGPVSRRSAPAAPR